MTDHAEIHEVMSRYCWCVDGAQWPELAELFTENGQWSVKGSEPTVGRTAIAQLLEGFDRDLPPQMHMISNPVAEVNGDRAELKCYLLVHKLPAGEIRTVGRYQISLAKAGGAWRIERLVFHRA